MSQGKSRVTYMGRSGQVQTQNSPDWGFIYSASTTADPEWHVGDRVVLPDGRVFRYAKASGVCVAQMGAAYIKKCNAWAVAPVQATMAAPGFPATAAATVGKAGSIYVSYTCASPFGEAGTGVIAADELRGGYVVIGNGVAQTPQVRGIIGNVALAAAGIHTIKLDAPLTADVTVASTGIEVIGNPYLGLINIGSSAPYQGYVSWMGVPAVTVAASQYFWLQTAGPCWLTSNGNTCYAADSRDIFFVADGSVRSGDALTYASHAYQRAGFGIDMSSSAASNSPFVMLQISN